MRNPSLPLAVLCATVMTAAALPDRAALMEKTAAKGESTWRKVLAESPDLSARELFSCALAWCETGRNMDRMERVFETAARMQDTDPASKGYGNFRWSWKHAVVFDFNAVDFSMRGGALLWLRHRDKVTEPARTRLKTMLDLGVQGSLRHKVRSSYTNIALMNAGNLILLGEALGKPDVAREGYARLEKVLVYTAQAGIHEFSSPTYYGVDLDDLLLIEAFCHDERGRNQARALLRLFWQDIALNYFPPASRYAGPYSRNYDYLHGWGGIEAHLFLQGWIDRPEPSGVDTVYTLLGRWSPPAECREISKRLPRTVRQAWGVEPLQSRTHFLARDISLGSASSSYGGRMDFLLTADLPGNRDSVRCFFVPDGRGDPYGKKKIAESAAAEAHEKALHLNPFWAAAQQQGEALALVVYRKQDVPADTASLESHFVMPLAARFSINGRPVVFKAGEAASHPVAAGETVILRQGTAALGIRVPWSNGAKVRLVNDANSFGAVRLTIDHRSAAPSDIPPAALLWLRAGSGLANDAAFDAWRKQLEQTPVTLHADKEGVSAKLPSGVALSAFAPYDRAQSVSPEPSRGVLECDGKEVGLPLLDAVLPKRAIKAGPPPAPLTMEENKPLRWEAEAGHILPFFEIGDDEKASGGSFVWLPGEPGTNGTVEGGTVTWRLRLPAAATFNLSARVRTPTQADDSFKLRIFSANKVPLPEMDWHLGVRSGWTWVALTDLKTRKPVRLDLPSGEVTVEMKAREDGAMLDQLELKPAAGP